jgi:hypothetical protein
MTDSFEVPLIKNLVKDYCMSFLICLYFLKHDKVVGLF